MIKIEESYDTQEEAVKVLDDMMAKLRESNQRKKGDNKRIIKDYKV